MNGTSRAVLAKNLLALMRYHGDMSQAELDRRSGVAQPHIGRILRQESGATIDVLDKLAHAFRLQAWQLLIPDLDPDNPPVYPVTKGEKLFYDRLRQAAREIAMHEERAVYKTK